MKPKLEFFLKSLVGSDAKSTELATGAPLRQQDEQSVSAYELEGRVLYSATPVDFAEQPPEPVEIADAFLQDTGAIEVAAMSASVPTFELLISNLGDGVTADGDSWDAGALQRLDDPDLLLGSVTDGTFSNAFDLNSFASNTVALRDVHAVQHDITIGSGGSTFDLNVGDVLFTVEGTGTLTGNTTSINADDGVYVFRPDHLGVYDQGEFFFLIDRPFSSGLAGMMLIDKPGGVSIPDGTTLAEGSFVTASDVGFLGDWISTFEATEVGEGLTAGVATPFVIPVNDFDINQTVTGLHIFQDDMSLGGFSFLEGDFLVSIESSDDNVGSNGVRVAAHDIVLLRNDGTDWVATSLVDGSDIGLSGNNERIDALTIGLANTAPSSITIDNTTIDENTDTSSGFVVGTLSALDDENHPLTFTVVGSSPFSTVGTNLVLTGTNLDFESTPSYTVTVRAIDPGNLSVETDLTITVNDINEAPSIAITDVYTSIPENTDTTSRVKVADITITDDALGSEVLTLTGTDSGMFEFVGSELFIKAGQNLDFETNPTLTANVAVDDPTIGSGVEQVLTFSLPVTDVNDAPTVEFLNTVTTLPENLDTSSRVKVADILVTDDALGTETLFLVGPDAGMFEIVGNELFIAAGEALDFETNPNLFVIVRVDDPSISNTFEDNAALSISITDVNEAPSIALDNTIDVLPEDFDTSSRNKIADIVVTDDALGTETLTLHGADQGLFEIVGTELFLRAGAALDFETNGTLSVSVQVEDKALGAIVNVTHTVTITDVNEAPSVSLANTVSAIDENTNILSRLKVADIQVIDDATGSESFSLSGDDANLFEIVGSELFLKAGSSLDYETNPVLNVTIEVDDPSLGISFEDSAAHAVNIADINEAPSIQLTNRVTDINENTTTQTKIADIVVTDDALGSETLSVSGPDASLFEIVGNELFLKAGQTIDFESQSVLSVTVAVDDATIGLSNDDVDFFDIDVNDVNEAPTVLLTNTVGSINENADTSAPIKIADISISDDAIGSENLIVTGADAARFEIVGNELFLRAGTTLDFESQSAFDVVVEVDDPTLGSTSEDSASHALSIVDVNEAPNVTLDNVVAALPENTDTTTAIKVADIQVSDDALGGESLSLSGTDSHLFEIVGNELYLQANANLNFESLNQLNVTVSVDDSTIGSSVDDSVHFTLNILDVNEAPSVTLVNKLRSVPEDITAQTKVADIIVTDDALGSENLIISGLDAGLFQIIGFELFLRANPSLDFESSADLDVSVSVDDPSIGSMKEDTDSMLIDVIDVNEAPDVAITNAVTSLSENTDTSSQTKIADILSNDDALGTNTFSLDGVDSAMFEIIGNELFLRAGVSLDFETRDQLDVTVQIDDSTLGTTFEDSDSIFLQITDVNEAPSVTLANQFSSVAENTTTRTKVADIVVTDDALGTEILSLTGADQQYFEIIGTELFLKANQNIDFETDSTLSVAVIVDDPTLGTGQEDQIELDLDVIDVNEMPSLTLTNQLNSVPENTATRTKIADIVISDDALGVETLSLSGTDAGLFEIAGTELFLAANPGLDHETKPQLEVNVVVEDVALGSTNFDSLALEVSDVNESPSVLNPLAAINASEDDSNLVIDISNVFADIDQDTLDITVASTSSTSIASVLIAGNSLIIELNENQFGDFSVDIVASDGEFSVVDTLNVEVSPVNDAPILSGAASLSSIFRDSNPSGESVRDIVDSLYSDIDGDSLGGIAVLENRTPVSEGRWQYFDSNSSVWQDIGLANQSASVALSADTIIRFFPAAGFIGVPTNIDFVAIDDSYTGNYSEETLVHLDTTDSGGTTPYSDDSSSLGIQVLPFGITVDPTLPAMTSESGDTATFDVVLEGAPTANVIIPISSNDETEGTTSTNQLVFTPTNWFLPQTIEVFGVDEHVQDGDQNFLISLAPAVSLDAKYDGFDANDVALVNIDNDIAEVVVSKTTLVTSENGLTDEFEIVLTSQPTDNVRVDISASAPNEAILSRAFVQFTPGNWNEAQTISVTGDNDLIADGDTTFSLSISSTSVGDTNFDSLVSESIEVTNLSVVGPITPLPDSQPDDEEEEKAFVAETSNMDVDEDTTDEENANEQTNFIPVLTREVGVDEIARKTRLLDYADTGLLTEVEFFESFVSNDFNRGIEKNDEMYEVYVEAKKLSIETALLLRDNKDTDLENLWGELDSLDNRIRQEASLPKIAAGTMASIASAFTAGYLVWLIRGGQILMGLLSGLPAWTSMDMLAVLSEAEEEDESDSQSLESIVSESNDPQTQEPGNRRDVTSANNPRNTSSAR